MIAANTKLLVILISDVTSLRQVSMLAVDDMYQNLAPIEKDKYWKQRHFSIPYTLSTAAETNRPAFKGSTFDMR